MRPPLVPLRRAGWALVAVIPCLAACGGADGADDDDVLPGVTGGDAGVGNDAGGAGGGSSSGGSASSSFLSCPSDTAFHLLGEVDGRAVEITEAPTTGGFSQQSNPPGPHFRVPNATSEDDEQLVVVYLTWEKAVASGEVTPVEGSVRLPLGSALPGETICGGDGSTMLIPLRGEKEARGDFQFRLVELSRGADCSEPAAGELRGCWRN